MGKLLPFIPAIVTALLSAGLQISGYTNFALALTLWFIAGFLAVVPLWYHRIEWVPHFKACVAALIQIAKSGTAISGRMPIIQFRDYARNNFNWNYASHTGLDGPDLLEGLRQAALDGTIRFWGRPNRNYSSSLTRGEPLNEIPTSHWSDYSFDWQSVIVATDNFETFTYNRRQSGDARNGGFADVHLDAATADRWLRNEAESFRGFTNRR